jgi:hypothetical protein
LGGAATPWAEETGRFELAETVGRTHTLILPRRGRQQASNARVLKLRAFYGAREHFLSALSELHGIVVLSSGRFKLGFKTMGPTRLCCEHNLHAADAEIEGFRMA